MSTLEISLALLAGTAIVLVGVYNLWIARKRVSPAVGKRNASESGAAQRGEPSLGLGADDAQSADTGEPALAATAKAQPRLDELADCIVDLELSGPVSGERLLTLTRGLRRAGSKPVLVEGRRSAAAAPLAAKDVRQQRLETSDHEAQSVDEWGPVSGNTIYDALRVGVLLANRHGAINAMEFSEFVVEIQRLAEHLTVLADTPDMAGVLAQARELDEACANLDAQIGIAVDSPEPLGVGDLARIAGDCDCIERGNNRYARLGPNAEVLFSMALADSPNRVEFLLDVPRAPRELDPWQQMVKCAERCAQLLDGRLVDEAGRPLPDQQIGHIADQLNQRYESLDAAGFAAGSPLALRLFN